MHAAKCPCDICDEWREGMFGTSLDNEDMLSGVVLESEPESDDAEQVEIVGSDMSVDEDGEAEEMEEGGMEELDD